MRRMTLGTQIALASLAVAATTVVTVGLFARFALSRAFDRYLASLPAGMAGRPRMGMGRMMLGSAEQAFVSSVDRGVVVGALIAISVAALVAVVLATYLSRPIRRLESATEALIEGDLSSRVDVAGPEEVAALGTSFNRMADSLERAEELRRRMVADVAHELRNPLAAARAQAEGMADGVIAVDEARLESLTDDLRHLSVLVNDLQELAVAEAGRLRYDMGELDLGALVRREVDRAAALAAPGVAMSADVLGPEPVVVLGDEVRLSQVLRNLLSNAARHTGAGSITVRVSVADGVAETRVIDTGEGLGPDELSHMFERFWRADAARAADTGGAGLGLAVSRAIVADHGGEMVAESRPGVGTEVGFRLPVVAQAD